MTDPTSLGAERSARTGDCRDWTPLDCLRETIRMIEAGEIEVEMIYISAASRERADHTRSYRFLCAGGDKLTFRGLLMTNLMHEDM